MFVERFGSIMEAYRLAGFPTTKEGTVLAALERASEKRSDEYSDIALLEGIRRLYAEFGYITVALIEAAPDLPSRRAFRQRFGSLARAYALAGVPTHKSPVVRERNRGTRRRLQDTLRYDPTKHRSDEWLKAN